MFKYIRDPSHLSLVKIALSHIEFEALHPFKDGNGRIGRMLITLLMWTSDVISAPHFYISSHLEEQKDVYIDTMRKVSENGDWTNWVIFFLNAVEKQAVRNLTITENIHGLYEEMKSEFQAVLSSKWSVNALDFMFTNPIFRNNKFTSSNGIPAATAARFTRVLADQDLLVKVEEPSGRKPALYRFEPLMQLVRV